MQHSEVGISAHRQDDEKEASHCAYWNASQSFDMQEISRRIGWQGFWAATFWDLQKGKFCSPDFRKPVKKSFLYVWPVSVLIVPKAWEDI